MDPPTGVSWWQQVPKNHLLGPQNSLLEGLGIYIFWKTYHGISMVGISGNTN